MSDVDSKKLRVGVLMGGPSSEFAVSVSSGTQVVRSLVKMGHTAIPILVTKDEKWHELEPEQLLSVTSGLEKDDSTTEGLLVQSKSLPAATSLNESTVDVVFIAMHGPYGEDGKMQALLELLNVPYSGSGVLASALSMDKQQFRRLMTAEHILIPPSITFTNESTEEIQKTVKSVLGEPPLVVKPSDQGSSIGVSLVHNWDELEPALTEARKTSSTILVDKFIAGRELTVGVIGSPETLQALPVTEIKTSREFFDYEAKYLASDTQEICPADLTSAQSELLQTIALQVFRVVGARGFARVDFILDENDRPYVLEINTIPGLTPASLLPKAAAAAGLSFESLIEVVLSEATGRQ